MTSAAMSRVIEVGVAVFGMEVGYVVLYDHVADGAAAKDRFRFDAARQRQSIAIPKNHPTNPETIQ